MRLRVVEDRLGEIEVSPQDPGARVQDRSLRADLVRAHAAELVVRARHLEREFVDVFDRDPDDQLGKDGEQRR